MLSRIKNKYVWLPTVIAVYAILMAWFNRDMVTEDHKYLQYFLTLGIEAVLIILLVIFLKKRSRIKK